MPSKYQQDAPIVTNHHLQGEYYRISVHSPDIVALAKPGQFVHLKMPALEHRLLRRPFSIFNADPSTGMLSIVYKVVGTGTAHLAGLSSGKILNLLGPLGNGFTLPVDDEQPLIVAGGYGCAATWMLAKNSPVKPICLLGGRGHGDLLLVNEYRELGVTLRLATDDGSTGHPGMVTDLLREELQTDPGARLKIYACGPYGMLKTVAAICREFKMEAEVSLDHAMCCGVGACFACVVKIKTDEDPGWHYARTCKEGPVFLSSELYWDQEQ